MRMSCIHCGKAFSITADQLGGKGRCPHCRGEIRLPKASEESEQPAEEKIEPSHWLQNSLSGLLSLIFHMGLLLVLALITTGSSGGDGLGEDVLIGQLPSAKLGDSQDEELQVAEVVADTRNDFVESLEVEPPVAASSDSGATQELIAAAPSSGGSDTGGFELGAVAVGGGSMSGGTWDGMLQNMRRHGLDIVIVFDSTGSMQGEIDQVKNQIQRIGSTLLTLVPKARLSICTYRDQGDAYVVRGLPLTSDIQTIVSYLSEIYADAGGDMPESVHEGLRWSIEQNAFRPQARKVILLFGDAPPHREDLPACLRMVSDFHGQQQGIVNTVTCRSPRKLPEFLEIAEVGGGEAFVTADERQIMTQLVVLVFGSRHRAKVMEAFQLLDQRR
ncbi:MAG: VWA domain-containing protein [Pirellulaceae bacterium]